MEIFHYSKLWNNRLALRDRKRAASSYLLQTFEAPPESSASNFPHINRVRNSTDNGTAKTVISCSIGQVALLIILVQMIFDTGSQKSLPRNTLKPSCCGETDSALFACAQAHVPTIFLDKQTTSALWAQSQRSLRVFLCSLELVNAQVSLFVPIVNGHAATAAPACCRQLSCVLRKGKFLPFRCSLLRRLRNIFPKSRPPGSSIQMRSGRSVQNTL